MSAIAEGLRRQRMPLMAGLLALALAALVWVALVTTGDHRTTVATPESVAAPEVVQPDWRMDVSVEGRQGKLTKADKDAFNKARPALATLIEDVYDGIFLEPGTLDDVIAQTFTKKAAASLPKDLGFPAGVANVEILRRRAHVGVEARGARHAAAELTVVAKAEVNERTVKLRHDATLWLEKESGDWKVIGYDVTQRPLK
ncbi:MAG: hypothetical protein ACRDKT_08775 [Actinomycetota bacterium]